LFYENVYENPEHQYYKSSKNEEGEYVFEDVDEFE